MTRCFLLLWLALSLSVASGPAFAKPASDCPMAASGMADEQEMPCCPPHDCALGCPMATLPLADIGFAGDGAPAPPVMAAPANPLPSIAPATTDPPPRTTVS